MLLWIGYTEDDFWYLCTHHARRLCVRRSRSAEDMEAKRMAGPPGNPLGVWLKRTRQAAGLTQETLAERAGLSVSSISKLERAGRHRPRAETLQLLLHALPLSQEE